MYLHSSAKTTTSLSFPLPHMKFAHQFFRNASSLPHSPSLLSNSSLPRRTRCPCMDSHTLISSSAAVNRQKEKLIVIIGATGSGKSRLSLDLATRHFPRSEIINSDKMQVYRGLDITTNKMPFHERLGVPHHFLGEIEEIDSDFAPSEFRDLAGLRRTTMAPPSQGHRQGSKAPTTVKMEIYREYHRHLHRILRRKLWKLV